MHPGGRGPPFFVWMACMKDGPPPGQAPTRKLPVFGVDPVGPAESGTFRSQVLGAVADRLELGGKNPAQPKKNDRRRLPLRHRLDPHRHALAGSSAHEHGGPVRLVAPRLYGWKSVKRLAEIQLFKRAKLPGTRGHRHRGDPWREKRHR
ncbi:molybdopterin-dependent oxidoreductase [Oceanithermus sp.]